jgi:hypothetical protein
MSETIEKQTGDMKAAWLGWAWVLPQALLVGLNWYTWILVRGDMTPEQYSRAVYIGIFEATLLSGGLIAWLIQVLRRKPIGIGLALAAIAGHIGYLWLFLQSLDRLLPSTVTLWMLPETELLFYQFSLMMPVVFLMLVRLARVRLGLSTPVDVGLSLAALVLIPSSAFIFGSLLTRIQRAFSWHENFQYLLIAALVAATAFLLVAFLRLMIRLHDLVQARRWSEWAIPLVAGVAAPLAGLALNATIPFPYDFQDWAVYGMTVLNGVALLIPFRPGSPLAFPGWVARAVMYPFTVYFFLVFLPFLPLSLLAMIAAGSGFLILAPVLLFIVHTRRLWEQGRTLATQHGSTRMLSAFAACLLVIPAACLLRNEVDRRTLDQAVNAVFNPDYTATRVTINTDSLTRSLERMEDMKHGIYLPYLSDIYDAMVFRGMVLPDEKATLIKQSLIGKSPVENKRDSLFGSQFLGMRSRNPRGNRWSGGVTRNVVVASHEIDRRLTNGVAEAEIRFVLENRGSGNGEFSESITVPEGVLVTGFWLDVNGTNKPAQLRERKAATWVYEMIRDMTRRDPGLVVYEDDRTLRLKVFPFAAGEKRRCGLTFRFQAELHPSITFRDVALLKDTTLDLTDQSDKCSPVSATLPSGENALVIPATVMTNLPSFRREVVAHLILDQSSFAGTNQAAVVSRARAALAALPPSISRVRVTWANYEQDDLPGESMSREEAIQALERTTTLPSRGGFCPDRVITRVLLAASKAPIGPAPAGYAPLFVIIPAPGSTPVRAISLAPFARLAPDLPFSLIDDGSGLKRLPFNSTVQAPYHPDQLVPSAITLLHNSNSTLVSANREALVLAPAGQHAGWSVWTPGTGRFEPIESPVTCTDSAYLQGLSLWSRHRALTWTPGAVEAALPALVGDARKAGVLIPEAAFIVLETKSQEVMLARKERQSLGANSALEFDEVNTKPAPAPAAWLLLPLLGLLVWMKKSRNSYCNF